MNACHYIQQFTLTIFQRQYNYEIMYKNVLKSFLTG